MWQAVTSICTATISVSSLQEQDRREVLNALRIRYGHRLFAEGDFDEAMAYFGMCSNASPLVLLNLFPSLAPPALLGPLQGTVAGTIHP